MDRPIKFRVWDGERMHSHPSLVVCYSRKSGRPCVYADWRDVPGDEEMHVEAVMQYTGLTDSEGTEIYEGDVLEMVSQFERNKGEVKERGPVEFGHGMFYIKSDTGHSPRVGGAAGFTYHVKGNIYEHPDLLEEARDG